jgi:Protein of unknown function (DUF3164)
MDIKDLTPKQLKELKQQLAEQDKAMNESRKAYKAKVNETVPEIVEMLKDLSSIISSAKVNVYEKLEGLITEKAEVYQKDDSQQTHSFSTEDGSSTVTIGFRVNDSWDDTVIIGVEKVKTFISDMGKNKETRALTNTILELLSNDAKGNLKASRVLQLHKFAEEINNPEFTDAIQIIQDAYRPIRTKQFVSVRLKNERGEIVDLPLSITDAPMIKAGSKE